MIITVKCLVFGKQHYGIKNLFAFKEQPNEVPCMQRGEGDGRVCQGLCAVTSELTNFICFHRNVLCFITQPATVQEEIRGRMAL